MNLINEFFLSLISTGRLSSILLLICIILLIPKKRMPNLIFGLFIIAWFLCFLSIINGIISIWNWDAWRDEFHYKLVSVFYSSLLPVMILSVPIFALLIKRGYFKFLSMYRWYVLFLMIAFIDVTLVWYFCANVFR